MPVHLSRRDSHDSTSPPKPSGRLRSAGTDQAPSRTVLMVAYAFPPCVCWPTAAARAEGFARHLRDFGWTPVVVTKDLSQPCLCGAVRPMGDCPYYPMTFVPTGPSLARRLRERVEARWSLDSTPGRLVRQVTSVLANEYPDTWTASALPRCAEVIQEYRPSVLWVTCPPRRGLVIGRRLARQHCLPWVADMRDSLARTGLEGWRAWGLRQIRIGVRRSAQAADALVYVSPGESERDASYLSAPPRFTIPSGFEMDDWQAIRSSSNGRGRRGDQFRIAFAGRLYEGIHDPSLFFAGVKSFLEARGEQARPVLRLEYFGPSSTLFREDAIRFGLGDILIDRGMLPTADARQRMAEADLLLHLGWQGRHSDGVPGGKLYEYLASGTEILHVPGNDSFVKDLLRTYQAGSAASSADEVAAALGRSFAAWQSTGSARQGVANLSALEALTWQSRTAQLAELLTTITQSSDHPPAHLSWRRRRSR